MVAPWLGLPFLYINEPMDWIQQNWPWLSALVLAVGKMIRDHFAIQEHEQRISNVEDAVRNQQIVAAEQSTDIKHIRNTVDALAERQGITEEDIKDIIRNR